MTTTIVSPPASAPHVTDAARLAELLRRAEFGGEPLSLESVLPLTRSVDRTTRGLAKRLLAVLAVNEARREAARLLGEACEDLDYRYPVVLDEAIGHAEGLGQFDRMFDLRVAAAAQMAARREHVPALVQLFNAAAIDFRHNARCINDPQRISRVM